MKKLKHLTSALSTVGVLFMSVHARRAVASRCERVLGSPFVLSDGDEIYITPKHVRVPKFAHITGVRHFPSEAIVAALGIAKDIVGETRILSIGEGASSLTEYLRERGVRALGLDQWYGAVAYPLTMTGRELATYVDRNRRHLIAASAMALPFGDDAFDLVVSHFVFHHLRADFEPEDVQSDEPAINALRESARVLKSGGRAIWTQYGDSEEERPGLERHLELAFDPQAFTWKIEEGQMHIIDVRDSRPIDVPYLRATITRRRFVPRTPPSAAPRRTSSARGSAKSPSAESKAYRRPAR